MTKGVSLLSVGLASFIFMLAATQTAKADPTLLGSTTFQIGGGGGLYTATPASGMVIGWAACTNDSFCIPAAPFSFAVFNALGTIPASTSSQSFTITSVNDPDFAALAAIIQGTTLYNFAFGDTPNTQIGCCTGFESTEIGTPIGIFAPNATVESIQLTLSPFQFTGGVGSYPILTGVGQQNATVTIEAFGQPGQGQLTGCASYFPGTDPANDCQIPPTPEPASMVLFGTGMLGIIFVIRAKATRCNAKIGT